MTIHPLVPEVLRGRRFKPALARVPHWQNYGLKAVAAKPESESIKI
jgi:hypothetical protein